MNTPAAALTQSVTHFRKGNNDVYDVERELNTFLRNVLGDPAAARKNAIDELKAGKDPVLAAFAAMIEKALAGKGNIAIAADAVVQTLQKNDPVKVEKAFVRDVGVKALEKGLTGSPKDADKMHEVASTIAGRLPQSYKDAFASERKVLIKALDGFAEKNVAAGYALIAINTLAAQRFTGGNDVSAKKLMTRAVELAKQADAAAVKGLVAIAKNAIDKLEVITPVPDPKGGKVTLGKTITLSADAKKQAQEEITAGAAKEVFPSLNGNNCGTHGYFVKGAIAQKLLEMARYQGQGIDTDGLSVLALLDTADECQIFMTVVDKDGHVANVGRVWFDELEEYDDKTTKPKPEYPSGFRGAYLLLKDAEYFGLGKNGKPTDDFDIEQFNEE